MIHLFSLYLSSHTGIYSQLLGLTDAEIATFKALGAVKDGEI
ncbi:MAG: hypothetical protein QNJ63_23730 [Calothrix sp. MO_192.B10]|nr:hypothetical protein [Calothrix sp. MO_192.B10]